MKREFRLDTLLIHGGLEPGPAGATTVPIVQSSSFAHDTAEDLEDIFRGRQVGHVYTRINNPTTESLERRLTLLEGGISAIATSSGMAAITLAVLTIVRSGDEILSSASLFGGTFSLFRDTLSNYGIATRFVDPSDLGAMRAAVTERTRLIFVETMGNPRLDVPDLAALAEIAREAGVPLVVDATVTTPVLGRVKELGADIVVHSTSKYINGTGSAIGGAIIDCGTFDWKRASYPHFEPFVKKFRQFAFTARARKLIHKDLGACPAPMNSYLFSEGIETMALRMERHCANAQRLAEFLAAHPTVAWVNYPGLASSPWHETAKAQFGGRYGALLTFGLADKGAAFRCIDGLRLAKNLANIGDAKTLVIHPASTICADFGPEEKALMGVSEEMIRVSVGIEAIDDIIEDFGEALAGC
ncbi:O-acetylhomoserine aminocarboxypropyltransferase/cysteine synthase family protein [Geobacter pickeringii]|uniref:Acetyl-L-homoserine sulfhydrolase n=1 Tax=Geobacter pickeringii TaxID=345632 RepID=A0A0B5B834_9BACT|nr:O-acetylhomoserine aminocarboxypropyltransferase/cysteine synthase family protein [Geobacter pickeringii]AJE02783.1 acetyl-L-homoserine sulfhydrolase [Geobacter pickeringii]